MPRVKTGTVRRAAHKKVLKANKGFRMTKSKLYKVAHEAFLHSGKYARAGRRLKKRDLRSIWITRINAALRSQENPISYSKFIALLKDKNVNLDRKVLSQMAAQSPETFTNIFKFVTK